MPEPGVPVSMKTMALPGSVSAVDVISDLHLSPDMPATLAAFADLLRRHQADGLIILGDLFEAWVGDDALDQPFEADCAELLRDYTERKPAWLMHGNRDFLIGRRFLEATGVQPLPDPCTLVAWGTRVLFSHGDALCLDDLPYQQFRSLVRTSDWQRDFLARPLPDRLAAAAQMRAASRQHQRDPVTFADADPVMAAAWLDEADAAILVHGHTHRPFSGPFAGRRVRHVLTDWDLDHPSGPPRAEVLRWSDNGLARLPLELA